MISMFARLRHAALILAFVAATLAGCAGGNPVEYVYVTPQMAKPVPPSECTAADPVFPKLPNGDVDAVSAVKDRIAIRRRDIEIARRRAVCRKWLGEQMAPASPGEAVKSGPAKIAAKS